MLVVVVVLILVVDVLLILLVAVFRILLAVVLLILLVGVVPILLFAVCYVRWFDLLPAGDLHRHPRGTTDCSKWIFYGFSYTFADLM